MFFFLALFVAGFILSAFFGPKTKIENAKAAGLNEFNFPRAKYGDPVLRQYGTVKLTSPVVIGQAGFKAVPITKKVKTGLFSSKRVTTGYQYRMGLDLAVALGPGVVFRRMWFGKYEVWNDCLYESGCVHNATINLPQLFGGEEKGGGVGGDVTFYCGDYEQPQDAYLAANIDPKVSAYPGIAHVVFKDFYWGNSPSILPIAFETAYFTNSLDLDYSYRIMPNGMDANPIEVLYDLYINGWGNLSVDPALIDAANWREIGEAIYNEGNGISLRIGNAIEGKELSKQILAQINAIIYEDPEDGLVRIKLLRQDYEIEDLPVFGPGQIVEVRSFNKKLWSETYNRLRLKFTDRANSYAEDAIAQADDFANIRYQQKIRPNEVVMAGVYDAELANQLAARELSNLNVPLYQAELVFNRTATSLKPGEPFIFQWPEYGIEQVVMRARKFGLGTFEDGRVTVGAMQDEFAADAVVIGPPQPSLFVREDFTPSDIASFAIYELPYFLDRQAGFNTADDRARIGVFAAAPASFSLGFNGYIEEEPVDVEALNLAPYSSNALLGEDIARFDGFDDGVIAALSITDFIGDDQLLAANTEDETRVGGGLFMIGNELFSFEGATDETGGAWTLETVRRARIDTGWFAHNIGDRLWFFDGQEGFFDSDLSQDAATIYLTDLTATGESAEDTATATPIDPEGRHTLPMPPDRATAGGNRALGEIVTVGDTIALDALPRARDAATLPFEDDVAGVAEGGTTYRVGIEIEGVFSTVADDVALPYDFTPTEDHAGAAVLHLWAKRDGLLSYSSASIPLFIESVLFLQIDYNLVEIDGEKVEMA